MYVGPGGADIPPAGQVCHHGGEDLPRLQEEDRQQVTLILPSSHPATPPSCPHPTLLHPHPALIPPCYTLIPPCYTLFLPLSQPFSSSHPTFIPAFIQLSSHPYLSLHLALIPPCYTLFLPSPSPHPNLTQPSSHPSPSFHPAPFPPFVPTFISHIGRASRREGVHI